MSQPTKRRPTSDLNHDNWDKEEEPEEKGEFKKATEDKLKERKILTARRKKPAEAPQNNPFGSLSLASSSSSTNGNDANKTPSSMFNFTNVVPAQSSDEVKGSSSGSPFAGIVLASSTTAPADNNEATTKAPAPTPSTMFNFTNPATSQVPTFDFSCVTSSTDARPIGSEEQGPGGTVKEDQEESSNSFSPEKECSSNADTNDSESRGISGVDSSSCNPEKEELSLSSIGAVGSESKDSIGSAPVVDETPDPEPEPSGQDNSATNE